VEINFLVLTGLFKTKHIFADMWNFYQV